MQEKIDYFKTIKVAFIAFAILASAYLITYWLFPKWIDLLNNAIITWSIITPVIVRHFHIEVGRDLKNLFNSNITYVISWLLWIFFNLALFDATYKVDFLHNWLFNTSLILLPLAFSSIPVLLILGGLKQIKEGKTIVNTGFFPITTKSHWLSLIYGLFFIYCALLFISIFTSMAYHFTCEETFNRGLGCTLFYFTTLDFLTLKWLFGDMFITYLGPALLILTFLILGIKKFLKS